VSAELLTRAEVAQALRVSQRTVAREIAAGRIAVVVIRGCVRILASVLRYCNVAQPPHIERDLFT
jgi:excisionase family DNA binding protein